MGVPLRLRCTLYAKQVARRSVTASATRTVAAPADVVCRCIADYREHHQRFLPSTFSGYEVEEGGEGEGTVVGFTLSVGGRTRRYRMQVAEPEPGRVLTESDSGSSLVTTFTVAPKGEGAEVSIRTSWQGAGGIGGFFDKTFAPGALRRVYDDELTRLEAELQVVERPQTAVGAGDPRQFDCRSLHPDVRLDAGPELLGSCHGHCSPPMVTGVGRRRRRRRVPPR